MKGSLKTLALLAGLSALGAPISAAQSNGISNERKAVNHKYNAPRATPQRLNMINSMAHNGGGGGRMFNQRQYRKHLRQNPCMRRSKKLRSRN